jgi:hypothetical protein
MLSENDIAKVKRLFERVARLESQLQQQTFNAYNGSPAFLVKAPDGGIPARVGNLPGYASCAMVRVFSNDPEADKELAEMATLQTVRNLGGSIAAGEIVIAHRDGFGDLFISGVPSPDDCSLGGINIGDSPIVDVTDADYIVGVRDGCTVLIEYAQCVDEPSPSGSPSASPVSPSGPQSVFSTEQPNPIFSVSDTPVSESVSESVSAEESETESVSAEESEIEEISAEEIIKPFE